MSTQPDSTAGKTTEITEAVESREPALTAESLIEDVSIDGMCGVY